MPAMFDFDVLKISDVQSNDDGPDVFGFNMVRLDARVTEIPRGPALTLSPETSIATAIESMRRRAPRRRIVMRTQRPLGVVGDRDILAQAAATSTTCARFRSPTVMAPCTDPLREDDSVGTALRKMCAHRQWHMPIVCGARSVPGRAGHRRSLDLAARSPDVDVRRGGVHLPACSAPGGAAGRDRAGRESRVAPGVVARTERLSLATHARELAPVAVRLLVAEVLRAERQAFESCVRSADVSASSQLCRMLRDTSRQSRHSPRAR